MAKVTHPDFESCYAAGEETTKIKVNDVTKETYQDYTDYWYYGVNSYSERNLGVMLKLS